MSSKPRDPFAQTTIYEWVVEELHGSSADILECYYWPEDQLGNALELARDLRARGAGVDFGLVRRQGTDAEGDTDRQYAYPEAGVWPERFEYGAQIPARLRAKLPAWPPLEGAR